MHAGCISEVLEIRGPIYTVGAACASGNAALRCAIDEVRYHDVDAALVVGAVLDFSPVELHAMALMGAITFTSFNDEPTRACRPWDLKREGFVPAHGGGAIVIETLTSAKRRGATIYAEILGVEAGSDANHLPQPSEDGQARVMSKLLARCGVAPEQVDYISAHATSTPLGDLTEIRIDQAGVRRPTRRRSRSMRPSRCSVTPAGPRRPSRRSLRCSSSGRNSCTRRSTSTSSIPKSISMCAAERRRLRTRCGS